MQQIRRKNHPENTLVMIRQVTKEVKNRTKKVLPVNTKKNPKKAEVDPNRDDKNIKTVHLVVNHTHPHQVLRRQTQ